MGRVLLVVLDLTQCNGALLTLVERHSLRWRV